MAKKIVKTKVNEDPWFKVTDKVANLLCQDGKMAQVYLFLKNHAQRVEAGDVVYYCKATDSNIIVHLEVGEAICSRRVVAKLTRLSEQNVKTALKNLEKVGFLTLHPTRHYTKVSFVNSNIYSDENEIPNPTSNPHPTHTPPTPHPHPTHNLEDIEEERNRGCLYGADAPSSDEDKKQQRRNSAGTNIPPSVEEVTLYCKQRGNGIDAGKFISYYGARGWELSKGVKMKNWHMAMSTWERNAGFKPETPKLSIEERERKLAESFDRVNSEDAYV